MSEIDAIGTMLLGMMLLIIFQMIAYVVQHWDERKR